jgi:hypothetical protein
MIAVARTLNPRDGRAAAGPQTGLVTAALRARPVSPAEVPNETTATTHIYPPPGRARRQTVKTHGLRKKPAGAVIHPGAGRRMHRGFNTRHQRASCKNPHFFAAPRAPPRGARFWRPAPRAPRRPCRPWLRASAGESESLTLAWQAYVFNGVAAAAAVPGPSFLSSALPQPIPPCRGAAPGHALALADLQVRPAGWPGLRSRPQAGSPPAGYRRHAGGAAAAAGPGGRASRVCSHPSGSSVTVRCRVCHGPWFSVSMLFRP